MKRVFGLLCFLVLVVACSKGGKDEIILVSGLQLDKHELQIERGGNEVLAVKITPSNATDKTVSWVSTNPEVATVSDGIVIGVKTGTTEIIAKSGNSFDKCTVSVVVSATSVKFSSSSYELSVGQTMILLAQVLPEDTTDEIEWSTSNDAVATVDEGTVKAISEGDAIISAKIGNLIATCEVRVHPEVKPIDIPDPLLLGTWVLDTYRFDSGEESGNAPVIIAYDKKSTLRFEEDPMIVYAHMGWEISQSAYTVDNEKHTIKLARMIEVSDDGQVLVMAGTFDILELSQDKLVLRQPYSDLGLDLGDKDVTAKSTATYTFHRDA